MIAIVSDLHANFEAVDAVFRDIDTQSVDAVVCLGDVVGYGASPADVMRKVMERCELTLLGNHDAAVLDDRQAYGFHERALLAVDWTRRALDPELEANHAFWDWMGELRPEAVYEKGSIRFQMVHASPREPLAEYLLPNMPPSNERLLANFEAATERVTFYGHTHHPGLFQESRPFAKPDFANHAEAKITLEPDRQYLVNVGSVGQPRDRDARACYALFDGETVRWRRVAYDFEAAARRILAAGLPESLAQRLFVGR